MTGRIALATVGLSLLVALSGTAVATTTLGGSATTAPKHVAGGWAFIEGSLCAAKSPLCIRKKGGVHPPTVKRVAKGVFRLSGTGWNPPASGPAFAPPPLLTNDDAAGGTSVFMDPGATTRQGTRKYTSVYVFDANGNPTDVSAFTVSLP